MKTLLLMRHAKAAQSDATTSDHDRPLTRYGKDTARWIGTLLVQKNTLPEIIISSTALRAKETVASLLESITIKGPVIFSRTLYLADKNSLLVRSAQIQNEIETALIVGHNPGLGEFINLCCRVFQPMSAGAVAKINFDIAAWNLLTQNTHGKLTNIWKPEDFQG